MVRSGSPFSKIMRIFAMLVGCAKSSEYAAQSRRETVSLQASATPPAVLVSLRPLLRIRPIFAMILDGPNAEGDYGNVDQTTKANGRLPRTLYRRAWLRAHPSRSRGVFRPFLARHRPQAPAQSRAQGRYHADAQPQP